MSPSEIREFVLNELPEIERRIDRHVLTKPAMERLVYVLRAAYRSMEYHGPGWELLPQNALEAAAAVLHKFRHRGEGWRTMPVEEHLEHAKAHCVGALAQDTSEEHVSHLLCRAMFAMALVDLASQHDAVDRLS